MQSPAATPLCRAKVVCKVVAAGDVLLGVTQRAPSGRDCTILSFYCRDVTCHVRDRLVMEMRGYRGHATACHDTGKHAPTR